MEMKDIIKTRRTELKLTLKEVADYVGVSEATLSRWESGNITNPRRDKIAALAKKLNISPSLIVGEVDELPATEISSGHEELYNLIGKLSDQDMEDVLDYVRYKLSKK